MGGGVIIQGQMDSLTEITGFDELRATSYVTINLTDTAHLDRIDAFNALTKIPCCASRMFQRSWTL